MYVFKTEVKTDVNKNATKTTPTHLAKTAFSDASKSDRFCSNIKRQINCSLILKMKIKNTDDLTDVHSMFTVEMQTNAGNDVYMFSHYEVIVKW